MPSPTDLEITRACAVMIGIRLEWYGHPDQFVPLFYEGKTYRLYAPLDDAAQNAALDDVLCEHGYYVMSPDRFEFVPREGNRFIFDFEPAQSNAANRRRARALCVWKIWESKNANKN